MSGNLWEPVFQSAVEFHAGGQLAEAASLFAAIVEHNPVHFPSLQRLAAIRRYQDRLDESLELLLRAVDCNPDSAEVFNSLGNTLNALGRECDAVERYQRAVALREDFPEAHLNLGNSLRKLERFPEAEAAYSKAIALRPGYVEALTNLAIVEERLNKPEQALDCFLAALKYDPAVRLGNSNVGMALVDLNRHEEAIPYLRKARDLEPDSTEIVFNEAITQLTMGNYEQGWRNYEVRWRLPKFKPRIFEQPMWNGVDDLTGKTVLLHAEQGLGDTLLFSRYVELVAQRGARIVVAAQKPLVELMSMIPGVAKVVTGDQPMPEFDLHVPFGSLPLAFQTTLETIPRHVPYLQAPRQSGWKSDGRTAIGVCWSGNPDYPADYKRSIGLDIFSRLFNTPDVRFISLQQNFRDGDEQILSCFGDVDLTSIRRSRSLADTAALISKLDLVITVDTAIAHLAGALGKRAWILIRFSGYWAWMRNWQDCLWYPTARLFRQNVAGDWQGVMDQVMQALSSDILFA